MTDASPTYTPPPGCTLRHVECWRAMVGAARLIAQRPAAKVPGLRTIVKEGRKARMPTAEFRLGSVFDRLSRQLAAWPPLDPSARPARAADLGLLAEAVAQGLGDPHDEAAAARLSNPVRPRADLDN